MPLYLLVLTLFFSHFCFASGAVEKEGPNILNVQIGFSGNANGFDFKNSAVSGDDLLKYSTNAPGRFGLSLGYRNLGLGISESVPAGDTDKKGDSRLESYSLRLFGKNTYNLSYQKNTGFYVNGSENASGVFTQKPDLQLQKISFEWIHNFYDDDFSLPAVFSYSGRQKSSGWGIVSLLQIDKSDLSNSASLVDPSQQANLPQFSQYKSFERNSASAGVGLAGVYVYENFQLAALLSLGGSIEEKIFTDLNGNDNHDSAGSTVSKIYLNTGYNGEKNQFGATLVVNDYNTKLGTESLDQLSLDIRIFYGYRFDGVDFGHAINTVSSWLD